MCEVFVTSITKFFMLSDVRVLLSSPWWISGDVHIDDLSLPSKLLVFLFCSGLKYSPSVFLISSEKHQISHSYLANVTHCSGLLFQGLNAVIWCSSRQMCTAACDLLCFWSHGFALIVCLLAFRFTVANFLISYKGLWGELAVMKLTVTKTLYLVLKTVYYSNLAYLIFYLQIHLYSYWWSILNKCVPHLFLIF